MRIVAFPLTLQSETQPPAAVDSNPEKHPLVVTDTASEGPPAYISLLSESYTPPSNLASNSGLPSNPRLAVPTKGEIQLTPDTLRYLASTVERLTGQMHEIQLSYRNAELRAQMQEQEFHRQQDKCREILELTDSLHGKRQEQTSQKLAGVQGRQKELLNRTDRILRAMMKSASPDLSEHETKWFEELKRLQREIKGASRYDQDSLTGRTSQVNHPTQ